MEKLIEVKAHKVVQICDECGEELVFTGEVLLSYPEKYVHKCPKCGNIHWFPKSYPCIEYR
jgi:ssDNA-binding Zn-finger/Zn-ribbon topoisomerase 1